MSLMLRRSIYLSEDVFIGSSSDSQFIWLKVDLREFALGNLTTATVNAIFGKYKIPH